MTKPSSELIALADCPFCGSSNISDRHVRDGRQMFCINCGASVAPTFHGPRGDTLDRAKEAWNTRTAANQSGSERAGVDRAKLAEWADDFEAAAHEVPRGIKSTILMTRAQEVLAALATPPAPPAAATTTLRQACKDCQNTGWCHAKNECSITGFSLSAIAHSSKIAAAETSPGDAYREVIDEALIVRHLGVAKGNAKAELNQILDWDVAAALDPAVSGRKA